MRCCVLLGLLLWSGSLAGAVDTALDKAVAAADAEQVKAAVVALASDGSSSAMNQVIEKALLSGNPTVEEAALLGLKRLKPGTGLDWLCAQGTKHPRKEIRDLLLGYLAKRGEKECFRVVLQGLYDAEDSVVLKAIAVLQEKDHAGSIPHMVRALQHQEDQDRVLSLVAERIREMLKEMTGADLFAASEWDSLWKGNKDELGDGKKVDTSKLILKGTGVKVDPPEFFGQELVSEKIVFILDTSISMQEKDPKPDSGTSGKGGGGSSVNGGKKGSGDDELPDSRMRLRRVQKELKRMVRELPRDFRFCLVSFDESVDQMSLQMVQATPTQKRRALKFIDNFNPQGLTSTDRALEAAFKIPGVRAMVLLSDGMPFRTRDPIDPLELLEHIEEINRFEHIPIHTVGFQATSGDASSFLQELSRRTNGKYTEIP